jgi:hypothetical protein
MLIMHRRGRACEIENLIDLDEQRKGDIVPQQLEPTMVEQMLDISLAPRKKIVHA